MTKKRGNPHWGKPDLYTARNDGLTSFVEIARELRLSPADYQHSTQLMAWVETSTILPFVADSDSRIAAHWETIHKRSSGK